MAQITYYFYAYLRLLKRNPNLGLPESDPRSEAVQFVVPTGNFGDILAGFYAKRMGLPISKLVIATNENDILHRFWQTGTYSKQPAPPSEAEGGFAQDGVKAHEEGVRETLSPAMDILVSSNFERLLWELSFQYEADVDLASGMANSVTSPNSTATATATAGMKEPPGLRAGRNTNNWFHDLKKSGSFTVHEPEILSVARKIFTTYRVSDDETRATIQACYRGDLTQRQWYILDPHSAVGVAASIRHIQAQQSSRGPGQNETDPPKKKKKTHTVSLATAHPAKFAKAVDDALKAEPGFDFATVLPAQLTGLDTKERKVLKVDPGTGVEGLSNIISEEVRKERAR